MTIPTPPTQTVPAFQRSLRLGISEIAFLLGLALMFIGLWLWLGLGPACFFCGCVLVIVALINSAARHSLEVAERHLSGGNHAL